MAIRLSPAAFTAFPVPFKNAEDLQLTISQSVSVSVHEKQPGGIISRWAAPRKNKELLCNISRNNGKEPYKKRMDIEKVGGEYSRIGVINLNTQTKKSVFSAWVISVFSYT